MLPAGRSDSGIFFQTLNLFLIVQIGTDYVILFKICSSFFVMFRLRQIALRCLPALVKILGDMGVIVWFPEAITMVLYRFDSTDST